MATSAQRGGKTYTSTSSTGRKRSAAMVTAVGNVKKVAPKNPKKGDTFVILKGDLNGLTVKQVIGAWSRDNKVGKRIAPTNDPGAWIITVGNPAK